MLEKSYLTYLLSSVKVLHAYMTRVVFVRISFAWNVDRKSASPLVSELVTAFSGKCWKRTVRMKWLKLSSLPLLSLLRVLIGQHTRFKLETANDNTVDQSGKLKSKLESCKIPSQELLLRILKIMDLYF